MRPVATEPDWVLDAWWGEDCRGTPLDAAAAVAKAKAYLAEAEPEEDKPKSAAYIASLVREWRDNEKSEEWIREKIQELENYQPEYEVTIGHIRHLRDCGLSKPRANRLISLWNQNNRPPLPVEKLRGLVSLVWEDTEILYIAREQRWRYRDTGPDNGSLESLLDEPLAPDDFLMGRVLSTDQRAMLFGPTGKGKTVVALAIGIHVAAGRDFLHWKGPGKPRRVLIVDGEMGRKGMRLRIEEAIRRLGMRPPKGMLTVISKEQFPQLRLGLDTPEGQLWFDGFVENAGGFDLIIFDNINTLCSGDTIGPEGWKRVDEWSLDFKAMGIGQLWVHHTGHNTSHEYGTVIRRNDMDTVIRLRPLQTNSERRSFALDFEKARFADRAPADFETVQINLARDTWQTSGGPNPTADRVELLRAALIEHGAISSETGLSEAQFAKRLSDAPAEQETWRNRLHVYFRRPAYGQLCGLVPVAGKQARSWWAKDEEIN